VNAGLVLSEAADRVEARLDGRPLWTYVFAPATPPEEAPRPYFHPLYSADGDLLTNFRPNDHPWHHGLSLTLTAVDDINFWGGPSYRVGEGYRWRGDQGRQVHAGWVARGPARLEEAVEWRSPAGEVLLREERVLVPGVLPEGWVLDWTSRLWNAAGRPLVLSNYHAGGGLVGSHYSGLQFRGARELLDEHGDAALGVSGPGGRRGEAEVHGVPAPWIEWSCQHDGSLRRTKVRFESRTGPIPWFVRAKNPLAAFAFHADAPVTLPAGRDLLLDHRLEFLRV